jgi:hypothetical protein
MTAKTVGNRGPYVRGLSGVGIAQSPNTSLGWVVVVGKPGDISYVDVAGLNRSQTNLGYFLQGGPTVTATAEFTLANTELATNQQPAAQAMVPWSNSLSVNSTIQLVADSGGYPLAFTAIKITFTTAGEVYIGAR